MRETGTTPAAYHLGPFAYPLPMFVVLLNYEKPLEEIDDLMSDHMAYLRRCYASGVFLASGRREPRTGGVILATAGVPLILGSYWAFVPVAVATVTFVVRTSYEDRMLRAELPGYQAYAEATRYRLLPLIW